MRNLFIQMQSFLNKLISNFRGSNFKLSPFIPTGYLLKLIGNKLIERIYAILRLRSFKTAFINSSSVIKCPSKLKFKNNLIIGRECYIDALGVDGIECGENVSFGLRTVMIVTGSLQHLGKGIKIGNNVGLGTCGHYGGAGGVEIGDDTIIGNYVSIHPENHNFSEPDVPIRLQGVNHKGIKVGKGCWIGAKATILDGSVIGDGCIVAAGAVVSGHFPNNVIIGGVPAKIIKNRF